MAGGGAGDACLGSPGAGALAEAGSVLGKVGAGGLALAGSALDVAGGRDGAGALALPTTDSVGGSSRTLERIRLLVWLAVGPAVAAVELAWIVVWKVALGAEPRDGHLLPTHQHDSRMSTFFDGLRDKP